MNFCGMLPVNTIAKVTFQIIWNLNLPKNIEISTLDTMGKEFPSKL